MLEHARETGSPRLARAKKEPSGGFDTLGTAENQPPEGSRTLPAFRLCLALGLVACGPKIEATAASADASGIVLETASSETSDSSPTMTDSGFGTWTSGGDADQTTHAETGSEDPLAGCVLPPTETASITGTIDGKPVDYRYAWFSPDGGGLCQTALRIVIFETAEALVNSPDDLPSLWDVPHLEIFIPTGHVPASIEVVAGSDVSRDSGRVVMTIEAPPGVLLRTPAISAFSPENPAKLRRRPAISNLSPAFPGFGPRWFYAEMPRPALEAVRGPDDARRLASKRVVTMGPFYALGAARSSGAAAARGSTRGR